MRKKAKIIKFENNAENPRNTNRAKMQLFQITQRR